MELKTWGLTRYSPMAPSFVPQYAWHSTAKLGKIATECQNPYTSNVAKPVAWLLASRNAIRSTEVGMQVG